MINIQNIRQLIKTIINNIAFILLFSAILISCRNVETQSPPIHYKIVFADNDTNSVKLFINTGAGQFDEIFPDKNIYNVDIPGSVLACT